MSNPPMATNYSTPPNYKNNDDDSDKVHPNPDDGHSNSKVQDLEQLRDVPHLHDQQQRNDSVSSLSRDAHRRLAPPASPAAPRRSKRLRRDSDYNNRAEHHQAPFAAVARRLDPHRRNPVVRDAVADPVAVAIVAAGGDVARPIVTPAHHVMDPDSSTVNQHPSDMASAVISRRRRGTAASQPHDEDRSASSFAHSLPTTVTAGTESASKRRLFRPEYRSSFGRHHAMVLQEDNDNHDDINQNSATPVAPASITPCLARGGSGRATVTNSTTTTTTIATAESMTPSVITTVALLRTPTDSAIKPDRAMAPVRKLDDDEYQVANTIALPTPKRKLLFGKYELPGDNSNSSSSVSSTKPVLLPTVQRIYALIHQRTGSIGGNASPGPIYGELTKGSMQKVIQAMKQYTLLDANSRFVDVGSGIGKPNLHVAQDPGVAYSVGVEVDRNRWGLGMTNLLAVLNLASEQQQEQDQQQKQQQHEDRILEQGSFPKQGHSNDPFSGPISLQSAAAQGKGKARDDARSEQLWSSHSAWSSSPSSPPGVIKMSTTTTTTTKTESLRGSSGTTKTLIGHRCLFVYGDIREAKTFDPFTHVYMFSIGFPPTLWIDLAEMWNRSQSTYLICYHGPRDLIHNYDFDVELLIKLSTKMHGSSEGHTAYFYRRGRSSSNPPNDTTYGTTGTSNSRDGRSGEPLAGIPSSTNTDKCDIHEARAIQLNKSSLGTKPHEEDDDSVKDGVLLLNRDFESNHCSTRRMSNNGATRCENQYHEDEDHSKASPSISNERRSLNSMVHEKACLSRPTSCDGDDGSFIPMDPFFVEPFRIIEGGLKQLQEHVKAAVTEYTDRSTPRTRSQVASRAL